MRVHKGEMARILGTTRKTFDIWVVKYPGLPVIERGGQGAEWVFESEEVIEFFRTLKEEQAAQRTERDELLAQLILPLPAERRAGLSVTEQLQVERLNAARMANAERARELVPAAEVREAAEMAFTILGRVVDDEIRLMCAQHGIPAPVGEVIKRRFDEARRRAVAEIKATLSGAEPEPPPPPLFAA